MDLNLAYCLAIELMGKHNLISKGWQFEFDSAKRRFGLCNHGTKTISLSSHLVKLNDENRVRNTILHEIAHALVGHKHHHNAVWKAKAIEIGCDGERCYSDEVNKPESKYILVCPNGHTFRRHKELKRTVSCSKCSSKYDEQYKLVCKPNPKFGN